MKRKTQIDIKQTIGSVEDEARVAALQATNLQVDGDLVLHVHGTPGKPERVEIPALSGAPCLGRDDEIAQVAEAYGAHRSVLLFGMPGIGKSMLAAAAIAALQEKGALEHGLLWISEIGSAPLESVCDAIARQMGNNQVLRSPAQQKPDLTRVLLARYGGDSALAAPVVADQVESYQTARGIAEICRGAGVGLLITSRTRHPVAEAEIAVPPLAPDGATALFLSEVRAPGQSDPPTLALLARDICALLEGHPLAIVVAAKRARAQGMSLDRLKARLANEKTRLRALAIDEQGDKSSSVWASLNLSYTALSEPQRTVLTRLAACFGRTTGIALLARVCGMDEIDCEDQVDRLVARSLVERRGEQLGLQGLVRDFGRDILGERLAAVQDQALEAASWYAAQYGQPKEEHFDKLEAELGNLLGALRHAEERQQWETALALAEVLGSKMTKVLGVRGYWTESVAVREAAIRAAERLDDPARAARFRHNAASLRQMRGDLEEASRLYRQNVQVFQALGNQGGVAASLHNLGAMALNQGNTDEARELFERSLAIKNDLGLRQQSGTTLHELGRLAHMQGDLDQALDYYRRSLAIQSEFNEQDNVASNQQEIGLIMQLRGQVDEARALLQGALAAYTEGGNAAGMAGSQLCLGSLATEQGRFDEALALLQESLASSESLGYRGLQAEVLYERGVLAQEQGQPDEASGYYEASLAIHAQLGDRLGMAWCQHKQGVIALRRGQLDIAERLLNEALAPFEATSHDVGMAASHRELARLAMAREDLERAGARLARAVEIETALGHPLGLAHAWRAMAALARARGDREGAASLLAQSLAAFERLRSPYADEARRELNNL